MSKNPLCIEQTLLLLLLLVVMVLYVCESSLVFFCTHCSLSFHLGFVCAVGIVFVCHFFCNLTLSEISLFKRARVRLNGSFHRQTFSQNTNERLQLIRSPFYLHYIRVRTLFLYILSHTLLWFLYDNRIL